MESKEAINELHKIRPRGGIIPQKRAEMIDYAIQSIEELQEYKRLEEQGLLLRLPCKVGTIVYLIGHNICATRKKPLVCNIDEFVFELNGCYAVLNGMEVFYAMRRFKAVNINDFGKTVFLTREEAEQALAEMKG